MKNFQKNFLIAMTLLVFLPASQLASLGQIKASDKKATAVSSAIDMKPAPSKAATDLARSTYSHQGGEKFRNLKSYTLNGTGIAISPFFPEPVPTRFNMIVTNDRIRIDMFVSFGTITIINNGKQFYNLVNGNQASFGLPSPAKFGLNVLANFDRPGYQVSVLSEAKQDPAFRVTDAEGNSTDFFVDSKTGLVKRSAYKFNKLDQEWQFSDFKAIEGVPIPQNFVIKTETPDGPFVMSFKVNDTKINQTVSDNTFIP